MAHCPVYAELRQEGAVARGKLSLIRDQEAGRMPRGRRYRFFLSACLQCGSCTAACPNQVDTALVIQAGRARLAAARESSWIGRFITKKILPSERRLRRLLGLARASRALWAKKIPAQSGLHLRLRRGLDGQGRRIPEIAKTFFLQQKQPSPEPGAQRRVSLFVGCVANYLKPQVAQAAATVLTQANCAVDIPLGQGCCGLPAYGLGENEAAIELAVRNLDALMPPGQTPPEVITSPCASCAYMLKKRMPGLLSARPELHKRAQQLAERVQPFSRLFTQLRADSAVVEKNQPENAPLLTFHDPCHLAKGLGERNAPRQLLGQLAGARYVEMDQADRCCGQGGSFCLSHQDLSEKIVSNKLSLAQKSGAEVLVTECSGCLLQLSSALWSEDSALEVISTAEAALRYQSAKKGSM